jgi:protein tyrosine phosphatase (PTP) superfamily phosphohydrolase (DUF442 family)
VVLVLALVIGNATILGASLWARGATTTSRLDIDGVDNGVAVDAHVWRGAAPTAAGYRALAEAGVTTIVDLRSDSELDPASDLLEELAVDLVRIPIRDGQTPTEADVGTFLDVVAEAEGVVFLHCGAGVGRTGAMAAAYATTVGPTPGMEALWRNLAVGPPSLEQIAFAARGGSRAGVVVTTLSRVLDSPRRIWHSL